MAYLSGRRNLGGASCPPTTGMTVQGTLARVIRRKTGSSTATGLTSKPTPPYPLQYKQLQGVRFYALRWSQNSGKEKPQRGRTNHTPKSLIQPASHHCCPTRTCTASLHKHHSHYQHPISMSHAWQCMQGAGRLQLSQIPPVATLAQRQAVLEHRRPAQLSCTITVHSQVSHRKSNRGRASPRTAQSTAHEKAAPTQP